jgi:hypothetical protein
LGRGRRGENRACAKRGPYKKRTQKSEVQPHAQLTYAPGVEMPREIEAATVPIARSEGP